MGTGGRVVFVKKGAREGHTKEEWTDDTMPPPLDWYRGWGYSQFYVLRDGYPSGLGSKLATYLCDPTIENMVDLVDGANGCGGAHETDTYTVMLESETVEVHEAQKTEVDADGDSDYIRDSDGNLQIVTRQLTYSEFAAWCEKWTF